MKIKISNFPTFNNEWQKIYYIADVVLKTLEEIDLKWPELVSEKFKPQK
jgi:hypothetical protein